MQTIVTRAIKNFSTKRERNICGINRLRINQNDSIVICHSEIKILSLTTKCESEANIMPRRLIENRKILLVVSVQYYELLT